MGTREEKILAKARVTLNDVNVQTQRWTDERLYELLNDGQNDMCRQLPLIVRKAMIVTAHGREDYKLPADCVKLLACSANGKSLNITSVEALDRDNPEWEEKTDSKYTDVVTNQLSQQTIRPYPLLSSEAEQENITIKIRYSAMPVEIIYDNVAEELKEELTISDIWDYALRQYVISLAFVDYGDESSISRSKLAEQYYGAEISRAMKLSKKSFAHSTRTTGYQAKVGKLHYVRRSYGRR